MKKIFKLILILTTISLCSIKTANSSNKKCDNCYYAHSIFVPRQLSYNPILENALLLKAKNFKQVEAEIELDKAKINIEKKIELDKAIKTDQVINTDQVIKTDQVINTNKTIDQVAGSNQIIKTNKVKNPNITTDKSIDTNQIIEKKIIETKISPETVKSEKIIITQKKQDEKKIETKTKEGAISETISSIKLFTQNIYSKIKQYFGINNTSKNSPATKDSLILDKMTQDEKINNKKINNEKINIDIEQEITEEAKKENKFEQNKRWDYIFSLKPIYTQNVGSKFQQYFNINHKYSLNVQENGSGDISSLWLDSVISSTSTFYSSNLSFCPKRQTYGSMIYFAADLCHGFEIAINTAIVGTKNDMHICERNIHCLGTCKNETVTQSFAESNRCFGKICGCKTKAGLDDIQVKLIYNHSKNKECKNKNYENSNTCSHKHKYLCCENINWDVYGLLGIPTGKGSKAKYLFEPLIGSKHTQLGLGTDILWNIKDYDCGQLSLHFEAKYRYAFSAVECRSFDLKNNCQWSRYMLFVNESDKYATYPAINNLTFATKVTPRSSLDLYLATHIDHKKWNFELGYDFWYRSCEKIKLCSKNLQNVGIADLLGIAAQNPQSASTANISQGVEPGSNQMTSDATFVNVTMRDINRCSGAAPRALSNSFYASIGYKIETRHDHQILFGINADYELGSKVNTPDNVTTWLNCDFYF